MSAFRMPPLPFDGERVLHLLAQDLAATLGTSPASELAGIRHEAELAAEEARDRLATVPDEDEPGDDPTPAAVQARYEQRVVDDVQQALHDTHAHTTWPPCPWHPHHPLWYDGARDAWCCRADGRAVAPLGGLRADAAAG